MKLSCGVEGIACGAGLKQLDACALFSVKVILGNADSLNHTGLPIQSIGKTETSSD
ncbi:MAG TPA: hypothetical protein PLC34_01745 [Burkholderiaceae bacterium]|jgi:hypothetical protein|nr:hypothetical protein [Burkholderiaceae bacterium]